MVRCLSLSEQEQGSESPISIPFPILDRASLSYDHTVQLGARALLTLRTHFLRVESPARGCSALTSCWISYRLLFYSWEELV